MTYLEYVKYKRAVAAFFRNEGIENLSIITDEDTGDTQESYFSHSSCDCCKRPLGGDRYDASGYNKKDKEIYTYSVCPDCLYFAEYGQLDDMTMMDIGKEKDERQTKNRRKVKAGNSDGNDNAARHVWGSDPVPFKT